MCCYMLCFILIRICCLAEIAYEWYKIEICVCVAC